MNKIQTISLLGLLFLIPGFTFAQWGWGGLKGNGNVIGDERNVADFNRIKVSEGLTVVFTQADNYSVEVVADENLIEKIATEVHGDVLKVYVEGRKGIRRAKSKKILVSAPYLKGVSASSGADFIAKNIVDGDEINISVSSGADVKMKVDYNKLSCSVSSGADAYLSGNAGSTKLSSSSGADINAKGLMAGNVNASASSGAGISVSVSNSIYASASSGGDIDYYGNPSDVDKSESSGGDVSRRK